MTTHVIEPAVDARFVRLNIIRPTFSGEPVARIHEFEVCGPDGRDNIALPSGDGQRSLRPRIRAPRGP